MPPAVCTAHVGAWGGDPLCTHCRTVSGSVRRREPAPRTHLVWRTDAVGLVAIVSVGFGFFLGLTVADMAGYPFH
jgi:hypothetical protein